MHSMLDPLASRPHRTRPLQPAREGAPRVVAARGVVPPSGRVPLHAVRQAFDPHEAVTLFPTDRRIYVVLPTRGIVEATGVEGGHRAGCGKALLLARPHRVPCVGQAGAAGLVLHLPRAALQAAASHAFDEPLRLAAVVATFNWEDGAELASRLLVPRGEPLPSKSQDALGRALSESLVKAIAAAGLRPSTFSLAKSVDRALAHVHANPPTAWTVEDLAPIAGVTAATLRKNFRACLGLTVSQVVREARLLWTRRQLASPNESRSVEQLAAAAGFGGAGVLARAYQHRFGETPTRTRIRAFAEGS